MSSLELWERLEKTDPKYTKQFTRGGGFKGTAINGTYILKRLTEAFGPCGKGWRFVLENESWVEGHMLKNGVDRAKVHVVRGHIEYLAEGKMNATSPQFGQTMFVDENKYGVFTDEEAPKKSITDCISKCAVLLGVAADVHLGMFDDNKYVAQRRKEEELDVPSTGHTPATPAAKPENALAAFLRGANLAIVIPGAKAGKPDYDAWAGLFGRAVAACDDVATVDRLWHANTAHFAALKAANANLADEVERNADQRRDDLTPPTTMGE